MDRAGQPGSVVVLVADRGDRYAHSYYDDGWVEAERLDLDPYAAALERFLPSRH